MIPCVWHLQPLYTAVDLGMWDEPCRDKLFDDIQMNDALDGLALMLFGGSYSTEGETVEKIIGA